MALLLAANLAEEAAFGPNPTLPEPTETISRDMALKKASVVSAGYALTKQASECGGSKQKTCSFIRTPPMTPMHSPKST
jgi:hypothetical protein